MATMTFLANFNGNLNYQNSAGTGTLSSSGTVTYDDSDYFAGKQGLNSVTGMGVRASAAVRDSSIDETAGAIAIRFRADTDPAVTVYLFSAGTSSANQFIGLRILANNRYQLFSINGTNSTVSPTNTIDVGADNFVYADWNGTAAFAELNGTTASGSRPSPGTFSVADAIGFGCLSESAVSVTNQLGGLVDCIAIWDGPLTSNERTFLKAQTTPWTWQMALAVTSAPPPRALNVRNNALLRR